MATTIERRLLVAREVGELLGCSKKTVLRLAEEGALEPVRLGPKGHYRFRVEDVERLIAGESKANE